MRRSRSPKENRTTPDGILFDSRAEMLRWSELKLLEKAGEISELSRQVSIPLILPDGTGIKIRSGGFPNGKQVRYIADFTYLENGELVYEEFKGFWTDYARLKVAVAEAVLGKQIRITGEANVRKRKISVRPSKSKRSIAMVLSDENADEAWVKPRRKRRAKKTR